MSATRLEAGTFVPGTFAPASGRGRVGRMWRLQAATELALALRHGEQLTLNLLVPGVLLAGLTGLRAVPLPEPRLDYLAPGILTLAVLSSAFTSQAIALGFDRRYGVIRRLAATALPRWLLVVGRLTAALGVVVVQVVALGALALLLGWRPVVAGAPAAAALIVLGAGAFAGLGLLVGGTLRAELTLAVANVVWFVLLLAGGMVFPVEHLAPWLADVLDLLPSAALASGLRAVFTTGHLVEARPLLVLLCWTVLAAVAAARAVRLR